MEDVDGEVAWVPMNRNVSQWMCDEYCTTEMKKLSDNDQITSSSCIAFGNPIQWEDMGGGTCFFTES